MICTRCGTVQRRETAKFCYVCGLVFEPEAPAQQEGDVSFSTSDAAPQKAPASSGDSRILPSWESSLPPRSMPSSRPRIEREIPFADIPALAEKMQPSNGAPRPFSRPTNQLYDTPPEQPASTAFANKTPQQEAAYASVVEELQLPSQIVPPQRPMYSNKGPVPGSLTSRQRPRPNRKAITIFIALAVIVVFTLVGLGIYSLATAPSTPEPTAFLPYKDPNHFSITYPNVWTKMQLPNGVRFADVTNTAELSITYTSNTSNQTAQQFADQQAAKEGVNGPDSQTFAGQTWIERSGIVTQTNGVAQDILLYFTLHNNFLYEIREAVPLEGYRDTNFNIFMPMLKSLVLL